MRYALIAVFLVAAAAGTHSFQQEGVPAITAKPPLNIGLSVTDAEKTARWYEENLGLARRKRSTFPNGKAIILGSPYVEIEILQYAGAVDARKQLGIAKDYLEHGIFKFGFYVDKLDETVTRLKQRKIKFYYEHGTDEELGLRFAIIADEDGNTIQLFEPAAKR